MTVPVSDPWWLTLGFWGEVAKLVAQLAGALLVAWLSVRLALSRYKAEKLWERETTALVELVEAIGEMDEVNTEWINNAAANRDTTDEHDAKQRERYNVGKRRLATVALTASVVLPREVTGVIDDLSKALNARYSDWHEDLFETSAAMEKAQRKLIAYGQRRMGMK